MVAELLAAVTVKPASEYGIDLAAIWGAVRLELGIGITLIVLTAGWMFGKKLLS